MRHKKDRPKKVMIATGGTGGHLFPAQALALQLTKQKEQYQVFFIGGGLDQSPYFQKELFPYSSIASAPLFRGGLYQKMKALISLGVGSLQACKNILHVRPDLVVGFGSFHSFPALVAAALFRVPILLFESNSIAGKVNRLFSKVALCSAVQFLQAQETMKGHCTAVHFPVWRGEMAQTPSQEEAFAYFSLELEAPILLVFGGSQGASSLNHLVVQALASIDPNVQVIHLTGSSSSSLEIEKMYQKQGRRAVVKAFETHMMYAWVIADAALCRAGAATLSEMMEFEVPAILVPYPTSADQHQRKNALLFKEQIQGALCLEESELSSKVLSEAIGQILTKERNLCFKEGIQTFKKSQKKQHLVDLIQESLS